MIAPVTLTIESCEYLDLDPPALMVMCVQQSDDGQEIAFLLDLN